MMTRPLALLLALSLATPSLAQPGWGASSWDRGGISREALSRDDREGKVDAERFMADGAAAALGKGAIMVKSLAGSVAEGREQATYEAAIIDQLTKAGYNTATPEQTASQPLNSQPLSGQIVEITMTRDELVPTEEKRNPLSGSATMGVSNRGSMMGLSLAYDATKPRGALVSTGLEIRIRDRASGTALYEARARIATRMGDKRWNDGAIATRLAAALFERFPSSTLAR